jgi:hypothetical protein
MSLKIKVIPGNPDEVADVKVDAVARTMELVPQFFGHGSDSHPLLLETFDPKGRRAKIYLVKFSGKTGRLQLIDRTRPVKSYMERYPDKREAAENGK